MTTPNGPFCRFLAALSLVLLLCLSATPAAAECPPQSVQSSEMQAVMSACTQWQEITYDPALGLLPDESPDPWLVFLSSGSDVAIIDGKLRIIDTGELGIGPAGYRRIEPLLAAAPMYLLQMGLQVVEVLPWADPFSDYLVRLASTADGERMGLVTLGYDQGDPVAVIGPLYGASPWLARQVHDWTGQTSYTFFVDRESNAYLEVGDQTPLQVGYEQLPPLWDPTLTEMGFSARGVVADISHIQICICETTAATEVPPVSYQGQTIDTAPVSATLVGADGRLVVANLTEAKNPVRPDEEPAQIDLELTAVELPGVKSPQFDFKARVTWRFESVRDGELVREIVQEVPMSAVGSQPVSVIWDGNDGLGDPVGAGGYVHKGRVELVRTMPKKGRTKVFDAVESPWRGLVLDRGNYFIDPERQTLLAQSILDPAGAPNQPLRLVRSKQGSIRMAYGEDLRIPLETIGCGSGTLAQQALCFFEQYRDLFGLFVAPPQFRQLKVTPLPGGDTSVALHQTFHGFDVFGGVVFETVSSANEVTSVYSHVRSPLSGPSQTALQGAHAAHDPVVTLSTVRAALGLPDLESTGDYPLVWPTPSGNGYVAVPAVLMELSRSTEKYAVVVEAPNGSVLYSQSLTSGYPDMFIVSSGLIYEAEDIANHETCIDHGDCPAARPYCSDHFEPGRCIKQCQNDQECIDYADYRCFPLSDPSLPGWCYYYWGSPGQQLTPVWERLNGGTPTWIETLMQEHRAYSRIEQAFLDVVDHHVTDMSIDGPDNLGGDYQTHVGANCGCEVGCSSFDGCGPISSAATGSSGFINLNFWDTYWVGDSPSSVWMQTDMMGHEWGHVLTAQAREWPALPPQSSKCILEGASDQFAKLFQNYRNPNFSVTLAGWEFDEYDDHPFGLVPPAVYLSGGKGRMLGYAHRSRFDWLECNYANADPGPPCSSDSQCPAYKICISGQCTNTPWYGNSEYINQKVTTRFVKLMVEGTTPFSDRQGDGVREDLYIGDLPLGREITSKIVHRANLFLTSESTLQDWVELFLSAGLRFNILGGVYEAVLYALGASGFFPTSSELSDNTSDRGAVAIQFNAWTLSNNKRFLVWKDSASTDIRVRYHNGVTTVVANLGANTDSRPAVVEYNDRLHIYVRDQVAGQLKTYLIHADGSMYGPVWTGPGLFANGAFDAALFQGRVYLVFGDLNQGERLSLAWCDAALNCAGGLGWHHFGGGSHTRVVSTDAIIAGPSAIAANRVYGSAFLFSTSLYIAAASAADGAISVYRVDVNDNLQDQLTLPGNYPSSTTGSPLGITVQHSAFSQTACIPDTNQCLLFPNNYLYLVWADAQSNEIYTSVLQSADPANPRFTRSVHTFYNALGGTGVSWLKGNGPNHYLRGVFTNADSGTLWKFNGYGRY